VTPQLFIRTDASSRIGTGHVMRCLALAQAWKKRGGQALFIGMMPESCRERLIQEEFPYVSLPASHPDKSDLKITLQTIEQSRPATLPEESGWIAVDGHHLNADFQGGLRKTGLRVLVLDDYAHRSDYAADIILNQNPGAEQMVYPIGKSRLLLGTKYVLLRDEFLSGPNPDQAGRRPAQNILVSMGGADPDNATLKILKGLAQASLVDMEVRVLVGPANLHRDALAQFKLQTKQPFSLYDHVRDMRPLMQWADVAVSAAGSTCLEFAYFGIPMALVVLAENQQRVAAALAEKEAALNLGWVQDLAEADLADALTKLIRNVPLRSNLIRNSRELVDGLGRSRVVEAMIPTLLRLRKAQEADCQFFWKWANEPYVRAMSFHSEPIPEQTHIQWFQNKLTSIDSVLWVAENAYGVPAGQIRFDKKNQETIVSLSLAPEFRGCGLGAQLIRLGCRQMFRDLGVSVFTAFIKKENISSQRTFAKAGFQIAEPALHHEEAAIVMKYDDRGDHDHAAHQDQ
jgi:UDP-2,4-diacetamido-2,4,6-trideoxy-beta-L-altropyranose hydrolase